MTRAEWQTGNNVLRMLDQANVSTSNRKLRLFACACCRRFQHLLPTEATRRALEASEGAADGLTRFTVLAAAKRAIPVLHPRTAVEWASNCAHFTAGRVSKHAALSAYSTSDEVARALGHSRPNNNSHYAALLRDIVGNPFRPAAADPSWRTSTVLKLAEGIYEERAFDRLPILADALMDAGCDSDSVLSHCRGDGPHVRGCWVVDLLLGKA